MSEEIVDVFGWLADRDGCGQLRIMQPFDEMAKQGLVTRYNEAMSTRGQMPKIIVGQRVCKDQASQLWQTIAQMGPRPKLVYEMDDDLWNIDPSNEKAYSWFLNGYDPGDKTYHTVQDNLCYNIEVADRVTVSTDALAEIARKYNPEVVVVPNRIPEWLTTFERPRREKLTIGWMGSATHNMDWDTASTPVRKFLERNPDIDFHLMGARYAEWLKLPKEQVVETDWIQGVDNVWKAIDFDIGIAPLRAHMFNRSKSAIKFLEYAALGIPTVASDVGPYHDNIVHGETGFLVKYEHEWPKYLRMLANDEDMRKEMGANANAWAKTQTLEGHVNEWTEALCDW